jgi:hypothetical protein
MVATGTCFIHVAPLLQLVICQVHDRLCLHLHQHCMEQPSFNPAVPSQRVQAIAEKRACLPPPTLMLHMTSNPAGTKRADTPSDWHEQTSTQEQGVVFCRAWTTLYSCTAISLYLIPGAVFQCERSQIAENTRLRQHKRYCTTEQYDRIQTTSICK